MTEFRRDFFMEHKTLAANLKTCHAIFSLESWIELDNFPEKPARNEILFYKTLKGTEPRV